MIDGPLVDQTLTSMLYGATLGLSTATLTGWNPETMVSVVFPLALLTEWWRGRREKRTDADGGDDSGD